MGKTLARLAMSLTLLLCMQGLPALDAAPTAALLRSNCSGNGWRGPYRESRSLQVSENGIIDGSEGASLATLQRLISQPALDIDSGLGPLLMPEDLAASRDEAFRWYSAIKWDGLWTEQQRAAYFLAYTRENILRVAARVYAAPESPDYIAHGYGGKCILTIPVAAGQAALEINLRDVPFVLPLAVRNGPSTATTYNALLAMELSRLFPPESWLRKNLSGGDEWLMFKGGSVGGLLPTNLQTPGRRPGELLTQYEAAYKVRLQYDAVFFEAHHSVRWLVGMTTGNPRCSFMLNVAVEDNAATIRGSDIVTGEQAIARLTANARFMSHLAQDTRVRIYPMDFASPTSTFDDKVSRQVFQQDADLFGRGSVWKKLQRKLLNALVLEIDTQRDLSYWILSDDDRLLLWKYLDRPPAWVNVLGTKRSCEDGMTCVDGASE